MFKRDDTPLDVVGRPLDFVLHQLSDRIIAAGGTIIDDPHRPEKVSLKHEGSKAGWTEGYTTGCGSAAQFLLPYKRREGQPGTIKLCGICDAAYLTARLEVKDDG